MNKIDNRLDLNALKVLVAIEQAGSITAAADVLHITQPAVSHALAKLRDSFDDPLFVRQGRGVTATPLARSLIPELRDQLQQLTKTVQAARKPFDPKSLNCTFRLGFRDVLESIVFPKLLPELQKHAPGIRLTSRRVEPDAITAELSAGHLDLVVDLAVPISKPICSASMYEEDVVVVLREQHPVLAGGAMLSVEDYRQAQHVMVTLRQSGPEVLEGLLQEHGIDRDIVLRCQHYFAACQVVAVTDWMLLMPSRYAEELCSVLAVTYVPLPIPSEPLQVRMYWHESMQDDPGNTWLRNLGQHLAKLS